MRVIVRASVQAGDECQPFDHGINVPGDVYLQVLDIMRNAHCEIVTLLERAAGAVDGGRFVQGAIEKNSVDGITFDVRMNDATNDPF